MNSDEGRASNQGTLQDHGLVRSEVGRMYVVKAARWHFVEVLPSATRTPIRRCSVCASTDLTASGQTALDALANRRYRIVRCQGCGYDLLEPAVPAVVAAS